MAASSDDGSSLRITPELRRELTVTGRAEDLAQWEANPVDHDIGAVTVMDSEFGKVELPIVWNNEVLFGGELVQAELMDPKDGGEIDYLDLTKLDWPRERAEALALAIATKHKSALWDDQLTADLAIKIHEYDQDLAAAAGWDGDTIDEHIKAMDEAAVDPLTTYTNTIKLPIYEPDDGPPPTINAMVDRDHTEKLLAEIEAADLPKDVREFLQWSAERHTVFRFDKIADYYSKAPAEIQQLMENSGMVIIDVDSAIEQGYIRLVDTITALYDAQGGGQNEG